jgi:hypothetical protein
MTLPFVSTHQHKQGRAEVQMVLKKPDGAPFNVDGVLYDTANLRLVIDGYNAPLTGGNFVDLVEKGYYKNKKIDRSDGFVVQMGDNDPDGAVHGYIPSGATEERKVPLEVSLKGDKELLYGSTSEDNGRGAGACMRACVAPPRSPTTCSPSNVSLVPVPPRRQRRRCCRSKATARSAWLGASSSRTARRRSFSGCCSSPT